MSNYAESAGECGFKEGETDDVRGFRDGEAAVAAERGGKARRAVEAGHLGIVEGGVAEVLEVVCGEEVVEDVVMEDDDAGEAAGGEKDFQVKRKVIAEVVEDEVIFGELVWVQRCGGPEADGVGLYWESGAGFGMEDVQVDGSGEFAGDCSGGAADGAVGG